MSNSNLSTTLAHDAPAGTNPLALSRTNLVLAIILIAQIVVTAYLYWPSSGPTTSGEPLLAGLTADTVTALAITDNNGRAVSFVKEGDTWTVADTDGYPARPTKITETLNKLLAIPSTRLVTRTDGSHDRLQVAENNYLRKVEVTGPDGTQTLYFGTSSGAAATHVRRADSPATYLEGDIAVWELDTLETTWIDVAYFQVPKAQVKEITLENANGTFTMIPVEGEESNQWTLADATEDEPIASANINTLVDRIVRLNLHSVLGKEALPEYGLDDPLATITVTASDSATDTTESTLTTTTFVVGAKDEERNTYYFKSSDSDFYVRLAAFTGDEFVNQQRSDFMRQGGDDSSADTSDDAGDSSSESASTVDSGGVVTATETITATGTLTDSAAITDTAEVTESEVITSSETITDTAATEIDASTSPTTTVTTDE